MFPYLPSLADRPPHVSLSLSLHGTAPTSQHHLRTESSMYRVIYVQSLLEKSSWPCECTFSQQLQETFEYSKTEEDGFLNGLLVRITLLAADYDGLMYWSDALQLEQPHPVSNHSPDTVTFPDISPNEWNLVWSKTKHCHPNEDKHRIFNSMIHIHIWRC